MAVIRQGRVSRSEASQNKVATKLESECKDLYRHKDATIAWAKAVAGW